MRPVTVIHPELTEMYGRVQAIAEASTRIDPSLTTLKALLARRTQLRHRLLTEVPSMGVRSRAWFLGEMAAVNAMIEERPRLPGEERA